MELTESTSTHDRGAWAKMSEEERRAGVLVERGLSASEAAEFAEGWPSFPETEFYTCCRCGRVLHDDAGRVEPHRLLFLAFIPEDGAYIVCAACDPLP